MCNCSTKKAVGLGAEPSADVRIIAILCLKILKFSVFLDYDYFMQMRNNEMLSEHICSNQKF